jgi:hypothetical protein
MKPKEDFHLKVAPQHVELLSSLPDFRELSTEQLRHRLPKKYRHQVPPTTDREARAAIIGLLALSSQIDGYVSIRFVERTFSPEAK